MTEEQDKKNRIHYLKETISLHGRLCDELYPLVAPINKRIAQINSNIVRWKKELKGLEND